VTPHLTQNQAVTKTGKNRNSAIDERTTRHKGMACRNRAGRWSSAFSDGQAAWHHAQDQHRGIARVAADFLLNLIAYNLIRIPNCLPLSHPGVRVHPTPD